MVLLPPPPPLQVVALLLLPPLLPEEETTIVSEATATGAGTGCAQSSPSLILTVLNLLRASTAVATMAEPPQLLPLRPEETTISTVEGVASASVASATSRVFGALDTPLALVAVDTRRIAARRPVLLPLKSLYTLSCPYLLYPVCAGS